MDRTEAKAKEVARPAVRMGERVMAGSLITSHTLTHMYGHGFYVIIPQIYKQLGLTYTRTGFMDTARWLASGLSTLVGGFVVDMFQHRRGLFLGATMMMLGLSYFLVSLAPTYWWIVAALIVVGMGGAVWHPIALGLLSQRFPKRRGLVIAMHRASGSVGDTISPPLVGFLLGSTAITAGLFGLGFFTITGPSLDWRRVLQLGLPLALVLGVVLWAFLWNVGGTRATPEGRGRSLKEQLGSLGKAFSGRGLLTLMAVSALRGMGDRALVLFLGLYLSQELKMSSAATGMYYGLLTLPAIATGPILGAVSDRVGRKPVIVIVLLVSAIFPPLIVLSGGGTGLLVTVVLFGLFLYAVNSLVQAAAMDVAEGLRVEGTLIGLLWGGNALFGAFSPLLVGWLADIFGVRIGFYYASAIFLIAGLLALRLPRIVSRRA